MKIGKVIEVEFTEPRIIPFEVPEKTPRKEEEQAVPVPNWPQRDPAVVPAEPQKVSQP